MRTIRKLSLLFILLLSLIMIGCQQSENTILPLTESDIIAIKFMNDQYRDAELVNDWKTVTNLYTDNAIRMLPDGPTIKGRAAILQEFESRPYTMVEYNQEINELDGYGDLAVVRGIFSWRVQKEDEYFDGTGKYIAIYRKQKDGTWLIDWDIFNQDK